MNLKNNSAMKFKTSEERVALCEAYCKHIEDGFSKESFPECDMQTLRKYVEEFPIDFDTKKMEKAERLSRLLWETIGRRIVIQNLGNVTAWIFNMKNRFSWRDRNELELAGNKSEPLVVKVIEDYLYNAPLEGMKKETIKTETTSVTTTEMKEENGTEPTQQPTEPEPEQRLVEADPNTEIGN